MVRKRERVKMGRPAQPPELVRRHRVAIMLRDDELAKLQRLADSLNVPLGTAAHGLVARGLKRTK